MNILRNLVVINMKHRLVFAMAILKVMYGVENIATNEVLLSELMYRIIDEDKSSLLAVMEVTEQYGMKPVEKKKSA